MDNQGEEKLTKTSKNKVIIGAIINAVIYYLIMRCYMWGTKDLSWNYLSGHSTLSGMLDYGFGSFVIYGLLMIFIFPVSYLVAKFYVKKMASFWIFILVDASIWTVGLFIYIP